MNNKPDPKPLTEEQIAAENEALLQKAGESSARRIIDNKVFKTALAVVCTLFALYHILFLTVLTTLPQRLYVVHWAVAMILILLLYPATKKSTRKKIPIYDVILALLTLACAVYIYINANAVTYRCAAGSVTRTDLMIGIFCIVISLEATRRCAGIALPIVALVFILYALTGKYLPTVIANKGYGFKRLFSYLMLTDGLFSTPIATSATQVFMLVMFGAFMARTGVGDFFMDIAMALGGTKVGGPAKMATISSALFGTISGSAVANVVGTGNFTIPLMKKHGYRPEFAGAVEAVASTGGQIMPPIMGAAAFVMADIVGVTYAHVCLAALIPALLYYFSVFIAVDIESRKHHLGSLSKEEIKPIRQVLKEGWQCIIPFLVLLYFIGVAKVSVAIAASYAILACIAITFFHKETRMTFKDLIECLKTAVFNSLSLVAACASAGIAIGCVMLTGLGMKFTLLINAISGASLFLALLFAALAASVLGMGLPTIGAYIISASVLATGLMGLGLPKLVAHFFLFYYSVLAMITPPVALAAYAGATVAGCKPMKVGFTAMRLGIVAFVLPFFSAYSPELLLIGEPLSILQAVASAILGTYALNIGLGGYLVDDVKLPVRAMTIIGGICMMAPGSMTDLVGIGLLLLAFLLHAPLRKKVIRI
ncbi:MAG: TRAP transporter permease [Oscillospiraceae bacterium]|nr:TRAP transporter permease [Oscillospiraceae bacterium]